MFQSLAGDGEIVATKVSSYSIAPAVNPDRVTSLPYRFAVELRDDLSGETASLNFEGVFSGSLWRTGGDLRNTFAGETARTVNLGGTRYTVSLTGFDGPDGYGDDAAGAITARVGVNELAPADAVTTPEPATGRLAVLGLAVAAARSRWRRTGVSPTGPMSV